MSEEYEVLELIGRGSFGQIHKVRRTRDGLILARKEISYNRMSPKEREQLTAEFSILSKLQHPNIVRYYHREHNKADQSLQIYMEYCGGGDLATQIKRCKSTGTLVPENRVWTIFTQIVLALYKCHNGVDPPSIDEPENWDAKRKISPTAAILQNGVKASGKEVVVHRDLKPENVFLDHETSVKLGDFGLSRILASDQHMATTYVGTPYYMSPEIVCDMPYTSKSDIWSLGCVIYELCALVPPFDAKSLPSLCQKIQMGKYSPIPSCYSPELRRVIDSCLRLKASDRPDTSKLLDLQVMRTMRREIEAVEIGRSLKSREDAVKRREMEVENAEKNFSRMMEEHAVLQRLEIDAELRKVWDEKAEDEIRKRVEIEVTRRCGEHEADLKRQYHEALDSMRIEFQTTLEKQVVEEVAKRRAEDLLAHRIGELEVAEEHPDTEFSGSQNGYSDDRAATSIPTLVRSSSLDDLQLPSRSPEACPASPMDISMVSPIQAFNNGLYRRMLPHPNSPLQSRKISRLQTMVRSNSVGVILGDEDSDEELDEPGVLPPKISRPTFGTQRNNTTGGSGPTGRQGLSRVYSAPIHPNHMMANGAPSTPPKARRVSANNGTLKLNRGAENKQLSPNRRLMFGANPNGGGFGAPEARKLGVGVKTAVMNQARAKSIVELNKEKNKRKEKENGDEEVTVWDPETTHPDDMPSPFLSRKRVY